jgi:hypothetical protein
MANKFGSKIETIGLIQKYYGSNRGSFIPVWSVNAITSFKKINLGGLIAVLIVIRCRHEAGSGVCTCPSLGKIRF